MSFSFGVSMVHLVARRAQQLVVALRTPVLGHEGSAELAFVHFGGSSLVFTNKYIQ